MTDLRLAVEGFFAGGFADAVDRALLNASGCGQMAQEYRVRLDELQGALTAAALRQAEGWQPIETAPKDGRWLLALCNDRTTVIRISWGRDCTGNLWWCSADHSYGDGLFSPNGGWIECPMRLTVGEKVPSKVVGDSMYPKNRRGACDRKDGNPLTFKRSTP